MRAKTDFLSNGENQDRREGERQKGLGSGRG